jgi:TatD DNase family protein
MQILEMLIDTHSHIYSEDYKDDIDEVITRAYDNDVRKIILPNIDSSSIKKMLDLADQYPQICYPMMGLHPTSVSEDYQEELELVKFWLKRRPFYGIGEIGIDLYWETTYLEEQSIAFRQQLKLAKEYKLPAVLHVRESFNEVFAIVEEENDEDLSGVFHSFTGTIEQAKKVIEQGFKIGVGGIVTFKNSGLDQVIGQIDPKHLILETDAPYLTPVPFRGKRNESSYLIHIARKIAELHDVSVNEVAKVTSANATELFGI